ncbi:hypothetical protein NQ315_011766 [Exocentrus adspersus]|uniref:Uncharacterized protein n=1 Tax=Exocentrus adspersus TaxID=1586481 RepID=A0AAV8W0P6_9CUCU|nr:hypothetical protein NQ315_011766 [Exocentrus adspersus]
MIWIAKGADKVRGGLANDSGRNSSAFGTSSKIPLRIKNLEKMYPLNPRGIGSIKTCLLARNGMDYHVRVNGETHETPVWILLPMDGPVSALLGMLMQKTNTKDQGQCHGGVKHLFVQSLPV